MNPPPLPGTARRHAFSLGELLAVLALGGILAALVLPAIRMIRSHAASAGCIANLKRLATAHRLYEHEHNGKPPPMHHGSSHPEAEGHSGQGVRLLRRNYRPGTPNWIWRPASQGGGYLFEPTEVCPSVRFNQLTTSPNGGPDYDLCSPDKDVAYASFYTRPSERPLLWDGFTGTWTPGKPHLPLRHNGAIHCAFLDGHVERISAGDGRLYHQWWYYAIQRREPDPAYLGGGKPMGITHLPQ
ncbi:MAG TPA: prepilin-type N-terminal cleavage/methylation domain-containing protein [Chthoniobacteraceae bacterium]|nr:prepilin-type N-terminal cleavage/methylation domain-containing protein [Chthoniobacteraceae bacterium]